MQVPRQYSRAIIISVLWYYPWTLMNNVAYCGISVAPLLHGSGVSGLMKIFDSDGVCLEIWSVSDYVDPIMQEFTYQCEYGETYTITFAGYAYSNNGTAADRLELSVSNTCINRN